MTARFLERLRMNIATSPERAFVHFYADAKTCETITYGDLRRLLAAPVAALLEKTTAGTLLFILADSPREQVLWWLAALQAGVVPGILTPITPKLDPTKYTRDLRAVLDEHPDARLVVRTAREPAQLDALSSRLVRPLTTAPTELAERSPAPGAPLIFQQSSGTTGLRKGLILSEGAVLRQLSAYARAIRLERSDVIVSWLPLYHDMGLVACLMQAVYAGVELALTAPLAWLDRPVWLFEAIARHRGTLAWLPNFAYGILADRVRPGQLAPDALASLRLLTSCSERVVPEACDRLVATFEANGLRRGALASSYALAENTFAATQSTAERGLVVERVDRTLLETKGQAVLHDDGRAVASSGAALPNVRLRVVIEGAPVEDGIVGEIELTSDCTFDGYFGVGAERRPFTEDGWYRTGDYGYRRGDELFVLGRRDDLIVRAGRNLDPADIERVVNEVDGIKAGRVVCFGTWNERDGTEDVVVVAELAAERVNDVRELEGAVQEATVRLAGVSPQRVEVVRPGWLVKSSSGKISRAGCRTKLAAMIARRAATATLTSSTYSEGIEETDKDSFRSFGANSKIRTPALVTSPSRVRIGSWVSLGRYGKILMQTDFSSSEAIARQHYPDVAHDFDPQIFGPRHPELVIGDGTSIGDYFFISCANRIEIGKHVLFSDRVFISDSNHLTDNPDLPISLQGNDLGAPIVIEDHSWIGINAVILEGVTIGRHSVVSAGSVVTRSVPPYSVVAGNPARVVKSLAASSSTGKAPERTSSSSSSSDAASRIADYLAAELGRTVHVGESLFRSGLIDSLGTLRLLTFLEESGLELDEQRFVRERPDTINDLCHLLP